MALGEDLNGGGGGPRRRWRRTSMVVEVHTEEERVCDMNLNGGCVCGMDLDGGGGAASRRTRRRSGQWGTDVEEVGAASK
jgi:hypothetical protein